MEQFLTQLPNTLIGWITTGFIVLGSLILLFNRIRNEDIKTLRTSNDDLRDRMTDQDKILENLRKQVELLSRQVELLKTENKSFQDLIVVALDHYFQANPAIALEMKGRLKK